MSDFVFKEVSDLSIEPSIVHYPHTLSGSSNGVNSIRYVSGSISSSYWESLQVLFYTSGSERLTEYVFNSGQGSGSYDLFDSPNSNFSLYNIYNPQYVTKFHGYPSGSIFSVSQHYVGDSIKRQSFQFKDLNNTDNNGNNPIIKDDGYGNLYSTNAHHSQSTNHSSHSDNYVGNIFYDFGLAVITETGSWSGSINYSDLGTNYELQLQSTNRVHTHEYSVEVKANEYNYSTNRTLRCFPSGSTADSGSPSVFLSNPYLCSEFTGSDFQPYVTNVALYNDGDYIEPVMIASFAKPIRISDKVTLLFKLRIDI
jgi:hypothetical protein